MREYKRTSRMAGFDELPAETVAAFRRYFDKHERGDPIKEISDCCETASTKIQTGFFGKIFGGSSYVKNLVVLLTPDRLFWCQTDTQNRPTVLSARFFEIEVTKFKSDLADDHGLQIFGQIDRFAERSRHFLGFGEEPAAVEFMERVIAATDRRLELQNPNRGL